MEKVTVIFVIDCTIGVEIEVEHGASSDDIIAKAIEKDEEAFSPSNHCLVTRADVGEACRAIIIRNGKKEEEVVL